MSGVVATTVLSFAPCVHDVLGNPRGAVGLPRGWSATRRTARSRTSLLGPVPSLTERTVETGPNSFAMLLENDVDTITVTGEYGGGEAIIHGPRPSDSAAHGLVGLHVMYHQLTGPAAP